MSDDLFILGQFTLRSGQPSRWKIECDALSPRSWETLAAVAAEILPPFADVYGVPRGGLPFALALKKYTTPGPEHPVLIAEDVVTTARSMEAYRESLRGMHPESRFIGVAAFSRGLCPDWVTPLFRFTGKTQ